MSKRTRVAKSPRIEWRVPAYLPYVQTPLTAGAVKKAEARFGFRLPTAYLEALREQNGGYLRYSLSETEEANQLWGIGARFPSILGGSIADRCAEDTGVWLPRDAHRLVPFAGDGHWYLCFDGRAGRGEPSITFVDLECGESRRVAKTFDQLVAKPRAAEDDGGLGLVTDLTIDEVAVKIGKALRLKIADQGDFDHGYRTLHGRATSGAQLWITPNEVPRGFARKREPDYATLVKKLRGTALRLPEHPGVTYLISLTDFEVDTVIVACARAGFAVRVL